jgi:hypothetical protein
MPMIARTNSSSMRVKPDCFFMGVSLEWAEARISSLVPESIEVKDECSSVV